MRRFQDELSAATDRFNLGHTNHVGILFLGNSLTLTDIDPALMQAELGQDTVISRWAIDDTNYLDWLFGLRRIFQAGGRPQVVVVGGKSGHFLAGHVRGNFFSHYILGTHDLPEAVRRLGTGPNDACNMVIAHTSSFYGSRAEVYKRVYSALLPGFRELAQSVKGRPTVNRTGLNREERAAERIKELQALCERYNARLILWLPPTVDEDPLGGMISDVGLRSGVPVLTPIAHGGIAASDYVDGLHLGASGASVNTLALAKGLKALLVDSRIKSTSDR